MIVPRKYMDLKHGVINICAVILEELMKIYVIPLQELNEAVVARIGPSANTNFLAAINTLFILGKIEYDYVSDAVIYLNEEVNTHEISLSVL
jgi:hypothetical protein